jgi:hypothetical protein
MFIAYGDFSFSLQSLFLLMTLVFLVFPNLFKEKAFRFMPGLSVVVLLFIFPFVSVLKTDCIVPESSNAFNTFNVSGGSQIPFVISPVDLEFFPYCSKQSGDLVFLDIKMIPSNVEKLLYEITPNDQPVLMKKTVNFLKAEKIYADPILNASKDSTCHVFLHSKIHPGVESKPFRRVHDLWLNVIVRSQKLKAAGRFYLH